MYGYVYSYVHTTRISDYYTCHALFNQCILNIVDLLGTELVKRLLTTVCAFLRSKAREVVRSTMEFIKVTVGVLPPDELVSHLEHLVSPCNVLLSCTFLGLN